MDEMEKQKLQKRRHEDEQFLQGCICVVVAFVLELFLFQVKNHYFDFEITEEGIRRVETLQSMLGIARGMGILMMVAAMIWTFTLLQSGKGTLFYPSVLFSAGFVTLACGQGVLVYGEKGLDLLMFLVPAWAGLGLVYFLYQVEFFISATFTSLGGIGLWLYRQIDLYTGEGEGMSSAQVTFYVFVNMTLLVIIGGFLLVNKAWKNNGVLTLKKKEITLVSDMKDGSSLWLVGLSGVIAFFALALSMGLSSAGVAYYCTYGLIGWLFLLLVYFTVKMM